MNPSARSKILTLPNEQVNPQQPQTRPVQGKGKRRKLKVRKLFLFACMAWGAYVFFFVQSPDLNRLQHDQQRLSAEIKQMEQTNQDLQKKIDQLNDPEYIAELARKKYLMAKDGETLFVQPKQ